MERLLFLGHDTQADVDSQPHRTGLRRHVAGDQAQERGLASPVRADHGNALTVPDVQRDRTEQRHLVSVTKADVFQPQYCPAARRGRPKIQLETPVLARLLNALVRVQVALQLARTRLRQTGHFCRHTSVEITTAFRATLNALGLSLHAPDIGLNLVDISLLLAPGSGLQLAL